MKKNFVGKEGFIMKMDGIRFNKCKHIFRNISTLKFVFNGIFNKYLLCKYNFNIFDLRIYNYGFTQITSIQCHLLN